MSFPTQVTFEMREVADAPAKPVVAAYATLVYGDFAIDGLKIMRRAGRAPWIALPRGVRITSDERRAAFDAYVLSHYRRTLDLAGCAHEDTHQIDGGRACAACGRTWVGGCAPAGMA